MGGIAHFPGERPLLLAAAGAATQLSAGAIAIHGAALLGAEPSDVRAAAPAVFRRAFGLTFQESLSQVCRW